MHAFFPTVALQIVEFKHLGTVDAFSISPGMTSDYVGWGSYGESDCQAGDKTIPTSSACGVQLVLPYCVEDTAQVWFSSTEEAFSNSSCFLHGYKCQNLRLHNYYFFYYLIYKGTSSTGFEQQSLTCVTVALDISFIIYFCTSTKW